MNNYIQPGDVLTLTAPAGGVVSGRGYKVGQLFVVAANSAAGGGPFEGQAVGVFSLPKTPGVGSAWTEGAVLYWNATAGQATTTATGNLLIGCAVKAAADADTVGVVRLNGTAR